VICLADARWTPMTERGWSALGSPMAYGTGDDPSVLDTFDRPLVLHLIGTPVGTSAGPRFRVGEAAAVGARSAEASVRGQGALLAVDRLPLDRFELVVLQEEPVGATARLETERARTADLRALAADAFMTGPAGMVMLPALPPEIAERVIELLAEHVHADATGPGWRELLDAVTRTRRHVAASPPPAAHATARETGDERARRWAETRLELALDITLFARRG
jgi:hypothetical protein